MRVFRPAAFLASTMLAVTGLGIAAGPAIAAQPIEYPGVSAHCGAKPGGLQECVDNAPSGATIALTAQIIDQDVIISKSLTLRAQDPALHPRLRVVTVRDTDPGSAIHVTLKDFIASAGIEANFSYDPGDSLTILRVKAGTGDVSPQGIHIFAQVPVSTEVQDSFVRTGEHEDDSLSFYTTHSTGTSHVRFIGNRITQHGESDSGSGILVEMSGTGGTTKALIANNRVWDVVGNSAGGASGIFVYPDQHSSAEVTIVGNTFDRVGSNGIALRNDVVSPAHLTVNVFDNVVSHTTNGAGLDIGSTDKSTLTFHAGYNDFFANDRANFLDGRSAGPGNLHKDPKYVHRSTGDLRLTASSPLIDRGLTCPSGGVVNFDASGNARLSGTSVDIGAYEHGAGAPTGVVLLGTNGANTLTGGNGADILCGYGGKDALRGRGGPDYLDGGSGADALTGGSGNDILCSRDGTHGNDFADGGSGTDSGQRDSGDTQLSIEHSISC